MDYTLSNSITKLSLKKKKKKKCVGWVTKDELPLKKILYGDKCYS